MNKSNNNTFTRVYVLELIRKGWAINHDLCWGINRQVLTQAMNFERFLAFLVHANTCPTFITKLSRALAPNSKLIHSMNKYPRNHTNFKTGLCHRINT